MGRASDTEQPLTLPFADAPDVPTPGRGGSGVGRRLVAGFILCCVVASVCWGVLPRFGVWIPAWLPFGGFGVILLASLFAGFEGRDNNNEGSMASGPRCGADDGRSLCCSGPRPLKLFSEDRSKPTSVR